MMRRLSSVRARLERNRSRLWKFAYLVAAGAFLLMGVQRRFTLPLVPILDADSSNYLWPGLLALNGEGFIHNAGLNFLYPGLLFILLHVFSDFRAVVILQHLLGLGAGVFFLLAWNTLVAFPASPALRYRVHAAIGLGGAGIYWLSPIPIMFETNIRPEAVCMFFQMLSFWLVLRVFVGRGARVADGIAAVGSALILCSLKPSYTLTALGTIALLCAIIIRRKGSRKSRFVFFGGAIAAALLLLVPEYLLGRNDRLSRMFLPETLFSVHANIIYPEIGDDLAQQRTVPFPRPWLQTAYEDLGAELTRNQVRPPAQFSLLGFNPDYLINGEHAIFNQWLQQLGGDDGLERFLTHYYWRAVRHRPLAFAAKIVRQMGVFYRWECPAFQMYRRIPFVAWHYQQSVAVIKDPENWVELGKTPSGLRLRAQTEELLTREIIFNSGKRLFFLQGLLARVYLPALLLGAGLAVWMLVRKQRAALLVIFFFLVNFGNVLAISAVHSMEVARYSTVQFAAALFAELWAISYLVGFGLDRIQCTRQLRRVPE